MSVTETLFRLYRRMALWFGLALVLIEAVAIATPLILGHGAISVWLLVAPSATRYWLLVIGVLLGGTELRRFVAGGATRHEFFAALILFGSAIAAAAAILIPLGHGLENAVVTAAGHRASDYPSFTAGVALRESGQALAITLAFFVSGCLFGVTYLRYSPWTATALFIPGAVPLVASQVADRQLATLPAFLLTLVVIAAGTIALRMAMRDVALRRTGN
jgi:hypothetical protein